MKRLIYLFAVMFTMTTFIGCDKKDDPTPNNGDDFVPIITLAELDGEWDFVEVVYEGVTYSDCESIEEVPELDLLRFNFNISNTTLDIKNICKNPQSTGNPMSFDYTANNDVGTTIVISNSYKTTFKIIYYKEKIIKVKLLVGFGDKLTCIGAEYELKKSN